MNTVQTRIPSLFSSRTWMSSRKYTSCHAYNTTGIYGHQQTFIPFEKVEWLRPIAIVTYEESILSNRLHTLTLTKIIIDAISNFNVIADATFSVNSHVKTVRNFTLVAVKKDFSYNTYNKTKVAVLKTK